MALRILNELLFMIIEELSIQDLSRFLWAEPLLSPPLTPCLYILAVQGFGERNVLHWIAIKDCAPLAELAISKGGTCRLNEYSSLPSPLDDGHHERLPRCHPHHDKTRSTGLYSKGFPFRGRRDTASHCRKIRGCVGD